MSVQIGTATDVGNLIDLLNAFLLLGHSLDPQYAGTGNGLITALIGTAATVSGGAATLTGPAALPVGTHSISAHYLGDATTLGSSSGTLNLTVTGTTTVAITTSPVGTPAAPAINVTIQ